MLVLGLGFSRFNDGFDEGKSRFIVSLHSHKLVVGLNKVGSTSLSQILLMLIYKVRKG
jgi:hypothetical protein